MDLHALITEYLSSTKHMQLATVSDGQPWLCTVHFVADENFNLYWISSRSRRHSLEILNDSHAAATVVRSTEQKQALQITGTAYEVADDDLERVHALYTGKFGPKDYDLEVMKQRDPKSWCYWAFKPSSISLWDEVNFPTAPKQEYELR